MDRYALLDSALKRHLIPDSLLKLGSKAGITLRNRRERAGGVERQEDRIRELVEHMSTGPVAEQTDAANEQHYELPAEFFSLFLGPRQKYSCALFTSSSTTLQQAEEDMLSLTCERAQVKDGMNILDLGCGWGSLSVWLADNYPNATITGVSNSGVQREFIAPRPNLKIITADVNTFAPDQTFDRVLSIEMFEHMRNWSELNRRIATWLNPGGKLFVHVFSHRTLPYRFENTWAADRFFTGGVMPSHDLMLHFQDDLKVEDRWAVNGTHYARTLEEWLKNLDANAPRAKQLVGDQLQAWRLFMISTIEIWGHDRGDEWMVSHYLLGGRGTNPEVRLT